VIRVTAEHHSYDIHCRWGALDDLGAMMRDAGLRGSAFVISDDAVGGLFGERALTSLSAAGFDASMFTFRREASKVSKRCDRPTGCLRSAASDRRRSSRWAALSGSGGLSLRTARRNLQAPTSLLAMVTRHGAVGGPSGAARTRRRVLSAADGGADTSLLASLPERSFREGSK
jgi:3-dehydroquinate synthase